MNMTERPCCICGNFPAPGRIWHKHVLEHSDYQWVNTGIESGFTYTEKFRNVALPACSVCAFLKLNADRVFSLEGTIVLTGIIAAIVSSALYRQEGLIVIFQGILALAIPVFFGVSVLSSCIGSPIHGFYKRRLSKYIREHPEVLM